ncbi:reverse transcriptase [Gossypium australe]|uniref:Reverse transcriptase n=1 Tax=Gossypium australe TaxID=47621 RepID=A0A5B6UTZ7_9ROSI|nr:reverse transcriptase [Gossypium australe]
MKSAHFIPVRVDYSLDKLAELYIAEVMRLHGVPVSIISDRDPRFTSSTAFHPQTDGQSERVIQVLEDMLRCCVLEFEGSWEKYLHLVEFAYNNSYHSSIRMAPYEALYGRKCWTPLYWTEPSEKQIHGVDLVKETEEKVKVIRDSLKAASDQQKLYADLKRKEFEFQVGDKVFLKVSPWKKILRFGRKGKLSLRFRGPYEVIERIGPVAYQLALLVELERIHNVFHVLMLRGYRSDPSQVIPSTKIEIRPDMTYEEEPIKILIREVKQLRNKSISLVKVLWKQHGVEEATWELKEAMREQYPNLFTVGDKVFLKVSLWKKILRFGRKGKLSPRFIGLYEVTERIRPMAYWLALLVELEKIHNVFHVLMLRRYRSDPSHVIPPTKVEIRSDMTYEEEPIKILAREVKQLRNKNIALVKVLWQKHCVEEATWELEESMREQYPNLFIGKIFKDENPLRGESCNSTILGLVGTMVSRPLIRG